MHLLTFFILSIYLKYVKVDELTYTHNGTGYVTDDEEVLKEDGYFAYNIEDEEHEVHYMNIRIITKLEFRVAVKDKRRFWTDGIVPYVLSKKYASKEKNIILEGMEAFNNDTCIRFLPRTKELVYILVQPGRGCSATIGKFDKNAVKLGRGCFKKGIVIHELMHVLGFLHEQSRPDRDSFVKINYSNILEKHKKNFAKYTKNQIQTGNVSYDYGSIMHYGPFTFAKDKSVRTVIPLQEGVEIGQRDNFSKKDLQKINLFYDCKQQGRRRRVKRHANHGSVLPEVVGSQYADQRKPVNYEPVRAGGQYYAPVQNPRQVYQSQAYPSSGYSLEERRRASYPAVATYPKAIPDAYPQWPSYSAAEQPKLLYSQAEQPKLLYSEAEQPKIVYPQAGSPNRQPAYSPVEYRRENYYGPVKHHRPAYTTAGPYRLPYPQIDYPKPVYGRPSYTTAGYRRPVYPPPYYRPVEYPYYPVEKPYTEPVPETTVILIDPLTTEQGSTTIMTTTPLTTENTTPTVTATESVTVDSTTLQTTTPIDTTTVTETTTVITTEATTVVTSTIAETTTLAPTSTVADTTTTDPPTTVTETTTAVPTSTVAETTTAVPTSTVAETTTAVPTSTVAETTTAVPTSTVAETTTAVPTSTVAETTTAVPTTTVAETTTAVPTTTVAETTTTVPTSTVTGTTTAVPTTTVTETTTVVTTEVPTTTQEITSTLLTTVETTTVSETTNATEEDIDNLRSTPNDYGYMPYYEIEYRGMGGYVSDRNVHSTGYHRTRIFPNVQGRTALRDPSAFWPKGIVPYEFSDKYDDQQKGFLLEAIQEFHNKTCVRFVPRRNQASYIFVEPDTKCSATIGKVPGRVNRVRISEGCYLQGTIIHELMHTLGFVHEQNRPDRDQYVIVMFDNIIPDAKKNFKKYTWDEVQDLGVSYDYDSVMHYSMVEFAIDPNRPTLVPLQSGVTLGQRDGFSRKDIIKINKLYKCRGLPQAREAVTVSPVEEFKKYFQSNIQRLFRNLFRVIQNFKPSKLKTS